MNYSSPMQAEIVTDRDIESHRVALRGHCYRMLGGAADADDAVQETIVRAWRHRAGYSGSGSLRGWLYRIATNVCLDALASDRQRIRPMDSGSAASIDTTLEQRPRTHWLEPVPDSTVIPSDVDPDVHLALRQSVRLAFVAALQHLPPRQRAALLLTQVLGWSAAETAEALETSVASVNSALQRARATLAERDIDLESPPAELDAARRDLLDRFVEAFERYDTAAIAGLLRDDAVLSMPPYTLWLQGPTNIRAWIEGPGAACRGSRLVPTRANGVPAFAQYRRNPDGSGYHPWALIILDLAEDGIVSMTYFLDTDEVFPRFGMAEQPPTD